MNKEPIIYGGGHRAGKVFEFCKRMGWSLKPFQKILLMRLAYNKELRAFIPASPFNLEKYWRKEPKKEWHVVLIEEVAYKIK